MSAHLDVSDWTASPSPDQNNNSRPRSEFKMSPTTLGLIGTLLVHGLVLQTVVWGSAAKIRPLDVQGSGSTTLNADVSPAETLILLDMPSSAQRAPPLMEDFASVGRAPRNHIMTVISADSLPHVDIPTELVGDDLDPVAVIDSGDQVKRARLFGIYSGQIHARIERGWKRPRTPVEDPIATATVDSPDTPFNCQVQIVQDVAGNVQEIMLPSCNGSVAWQRSLVIAIQQSSPLPAPPDPTVFSRTITLGFMGYSFVRGSDDEEYEVPTANMARFHSQ